MVHKHAKAQFEEAVNLVLSLQIRNITIGAQQQANEYEKLWPRWSKLVRDGEVTEAFKDIRVRVLPNESFRSAFKQATVADAKIVRHLLRRLDPICRPGNGISPMEVEVEHILPKSVVTQLLRGKSLSKNVRRWLEELGFDIPNTSTEKEELGKRVRDHINLLGNQALLNDKENNAQKDSSFSEKKKSYEKQALELTMDLTKKGTWNFGEIRARQEQLAESAVSLW